MGGVWRVVIALSFFFVVAFAFFQKIFKIAIKINEKSFFPAIMEVEKRRRFDARMG